MNKKLYLTFRKDEIEKLKYERLINQVKQILSLDTYFKKENSREALKKIQEYYQKLINSYSCINQKCRNSQLALSANCQHEIIIKNDTSYCLCAMCHSFLNIETIPSSMVIDLQDYQISTNSDSIQIIYDMVDFCIIDNLDIYEELQSLLLTRNHNHK